MEQYPLSQQVTKAVEDFHNAQAEYGVSLNDLMNSSRNTSGGYVAPEAMQKVNRANQRVVDSALFLASVVWNNRNEISAAIQSTEGATNG